MTGQHDPFGAHAGDPSRRSRGKDRQSGAPLPVARRGLDPSLVGHLGQVVTVAVSGGRSAMSGGRRSSSNATAGIAAYTPVVIFFFGAGSSRPAASAAPPSRSEGRCSSRVSPVSARSPLRAPDHAPSGTGRRRVRPDDSSFTLNTPATGTGSAAYSFAVYSGLGSWRGLVGCGVAVQIPPAWMVWRWVVVWWNPSASAMTGAGAWRARWRMAATRASRSGTPRSRRHWLRPV